MATVTKSIGTGSRDYSTMTTWEADLDEGVIYSSGDDAVGECYNDSAFDESVTINGGGTVGLNSVTLTVAEGERHDGTAGTGARIVSVMSNRGRISINRGNTVVSWLESNLDSSGRTDSHVVAALAPNAANIFMSHLIIHGWKAGDSFIAIGSSTFTNDGSVPPIVHNCIVYNGTTLFTNRINRGLGCKQSLASCHARVYNSTAHSIVDDGGSGNEGHGLTLKSPGAGVTSEGRNNICTDSSVVDFNVLSATVSHNASSDTTASGTGSLTEIVTADQYVSTLTGFEDLHLKSGSDCIDAGTDLGTTPTGVNIDIDGRDRDAEGDVWDIGADEFVSADLPQRPFVRPFASPFSEAF